MIVCPACSSTSCYTVYRSPIEPAEDTFRCLICSKTFTRYKEEKPVAPSERVGRILQTITNYLMGHISVEELVIALRFHCDRLEKEKPCENK